MSHGITDAQLDTLIDGLEAYAKSGVSDPWLLSDGTVIEPLHVLYELRAWRKQISTAMLTARKQP